MTAVIDVTPGQHKIILDLLRRHLPDTTAWVYGSRVKGATRTCSDLDMVVFSAPEQWLQVSNLREAFDESSLPFKVDLFVWDDLPENFKKNIEAEAAVLTGKNKKRIPDSWKKTTIGDICTKTTSGGTPRTTNKEYWDNGSIPWLTTKEVNFSRIYSTEKHITEAGVKGSSAKWIPENSVIMAMYAAPTAGKVAINKIPLTTNQACYNLMIDNEMADYEFVYYYLSSEYMTLSNLANGAAQQNLSSTIINNFPIHLPPLPEQHAIAHILGSLDDKIEHNRRMNETLEAMAQALFKSWFVNFDPVIDNALAAGNRIPEPLQARAALRKNQGSARKPLPDNIRRLFPAEFRLTKEMGYIPAGWEAAPLPDMIDFLEGPGIRNWQYTNTDEGTRFINIRCIQGGDLQLKTANRIKDEEANGRYKHFLLDKMDIVVSTSGTLGRFAVVREHHLPLLLNTSVIRFRPVKPFCTFCYLLGYIETHLPKELDLRAAGSVQRNFGPMHLKQIIMLKPDREVLDAHQNTAFTLTEEILENRIHNDTLTALRDTLLPRLLSGEIRVPESEQQFGDGNQ